MQVVNTNTFKSNQTKRVFNIPYHYMPKSMDYVRILYDIQFEGKSETSFNFRLNARFFLSDFIIFLPEP